MQAIIAVLMSLIGLGEWLGELIVDTLTAIVEWLVDWFMAVATLAFEWLLALISSTGIFDFFTIEIPPAFGLVTRFISQFVPLLEITTLCLSSLAVVIAVNVIRWCATFVPGGNFGG